MTKLCIFCGSRVNTQEDAWAKWLIRFLKKHAKEKIRVNFSIEGEPLKKWLAKNAAIRVGHVCHTCNSGWMSDMENEVKPILIPMILGNPVTLSAMQKFIISAWLTKCAMVFDGMLEESSFYNSLDRLDFRKSHTPSLSNTNVWLGGYNGTVRLRAYTHYGTVLKRGQHAGEFAHVNVFTMAFGRLVLQISSIKKLVHQHGVFSNNVTMQPGRWDDLTIQIWPPIILPNPSRWPPTLSFDDSQCHLQRLSDRFNGI